MARLARLVMPGLPHHITQRGNRRQQTFFTDNDYRTYISLMAGSCREQAVEVWAYCLMPNHVHLIAVPDSEGGLRAAIGEAHRRYTKLINSRLEWTGYLWQGRFASCVMDQAHLLAAARYIELNPVRSGLVKTPEAYPWSSAKAHLTGQKDGLVKATTLLGLVDDWPTFLSDELSEKQLLDLRGHQRTGRPLGSEDFVTELELKSGRPLRKKKRGPKGPGNN
jgi:putative transposase